MEKSMIHVGYHVNCSHHIFDRMSGGSIDSEIPADPGNRSMLAQTGIDLLPKFYFRCKSSRCQKFVLFRR
jgi:hypothetical protein